MRRLQPELLLKLYDEADSMVLALPLARHKLRILLLNCLWLLGAIFALFKLFAFLV